MDLEKCFAQIEATEGWLTVQEGLALMELAKKSKSGVIEIGSWKGKSTSYLLLGSYLGNKCPIEAIDTFEGSPEHKLKGIKTINDFKKNISALPFETKMLSVYENKSELIYSNFENEDYDVLLIDGNHSLIHVIKDFALYYDKIKPNGYIALHDFGKEGWAGPTHFGEMLMKEFSDCEQIGSLLIVKKNSFKGLGSWK